MADEQSRPRPVWCVVSQRQVVAGIAVAPAGNVPRASDGSPTSRRWLTALSTQLGEREQLLRHTLYHCSGCEQRFLGERRCPDCNLMLKKLGLGGLCPGCDELVLVSELLEG